MERTKPFGMIICLLLVNINIMGAISSLEEDDKECADEMTNLASCIPYVSGTAKKPTPECCDDTQKVKNTKPKCLCVLIKDSTDPSMGLPINTTLALQMPSACNTDAKVSDCPSILNLPADSPDAKIFKIGGTDSSINSTGNSAPATGSGSSTMPQSSPTTDSGAKGSSTDTKKVPASNEGEKVPQSILIMIGLVSLAFIFM